MYLVPGIAVEKSRSQLAANNNNTQIFLVSQVICGLGTGVKHHVVLVLKQNDWHRDTHLIIQQ